MNRSRQLTRLVMLLCILAAASPAGADDVVSADFKLLPSGGIKKLGYELPNPLALSPDKPVALKKAPQMESPRYGELAFAGNDYLLALDEPLLRDAKLYVDANGTGDLTNDAPAILKKLSYSRDGKKYTGRIGNFTLPLPTANGRALVQLEAYCLDKTDPGAAQFPKVSTLYYAADYAYDVQISVNAANYRAMLIDPDADGDFRTLSVPGRPNAGELLIDVNGNSKFEDELIPWRPFTLNGLTCQLCSSGRGGSFDVEWIRKPPVPSNLFKGHAVVPFAAQTIGGNRVNFPGDYKGSLVILDFWATWCGPCLGEMPGLAKAYAAYHSKGIEILGVCLDPPNAAEKVKKVTAGQKMAWPQIYDGLGWSECISQAYGVNMIPQAFLVDGDTGEIMADGDALRGAQLATTLNTALAEKAKSGAAN